MDEPKQNTVITELTDGRVIDLTGLSAREAIDKIRAAMREKESTIKHTMHVVHGDLHMLTVAHDEQFHAYMNALYPDWREWEDREKRYAAKAWNFGRLYGLPQQETVVEYIARITGITKEG